MLALPVFDGVTLFFVLSGFLTGRILLRTIEREDFRYFEKPVMDLRDRWSRKGHAPAQAYQEQGTTIG